MRIARSDSLSTNKKYRGAYSGAVAADEMNRADQDDRADHGHRDEADTAARLHAKLAENPVPDDRADETEKDVREESVAAAMHQFAGQPSGDQSGDDDSEQANLLNKQEVRQTDRTQSIIRSWRTTAPGEARTRLHQMRFVIISARSCPRGLASSLSVSAAINAESLLLFERPAAALELARAALGDDYL
jgi:hypothetical protein